MKTLRHLSAAKESIPSGPARAVLRFSIFMALFGLVIPSVSAAVRVSARSGSWKAGSTWVGGKVPAARDEVVIASDHQVTFDGAANHQDECARLTIQAGAVLYFSQSATSFQVGGDGPGIPGGIDVAGTLAVRAGVTVEIDPDGNAGAEEDGVTVRAGGELRLLGTVIHQGQVATVVSDDNNSDIAFSDPTLSIGSRTAPYRVVWRSGQRKGRWYDIASLSQGVLSLDYRSRSNAERLGEPDYRTGLASVAGRTVTGSGTQWSPATGNGSWWWCAADGIQRRVRIVRVVSPTSLWLAKDYGFSACASPSPYVMRDENQPYAAADSTERILPGDSYQVILPATLRSRNGSDDNFDEQIFVRLERGSTYLFWNASFESVGKEAWRFSEGSGIRIVGFQGPASKGMINTVEIYRYGGDAAIEWEDSSNFDVDWLFLHWAHPMVTRNEGHGVKIEHTTSEGSADNVRIRNARFDRTNDDFVWWNTLSGGSSGVYDSIGKYCPNTSTGDSCDAVDTDDGFGRTGGQLRIERNVFANIGSNNGGSCLSAAVGKQTTQPAWRGDGWVARDNVCLNLQGLPCLRTVGGGLNWGLEQIWAVNNACVGVDAHGFLGIPYAYQNEIINYGAAREPGMSGFRSLYQAHGNLVWGVGRESASDDPDQYGASIGFGLDREANWTGTTWSLTDNLFFVSKAGVLLWSWSSSTYPAIGDARVSHNTFVGNPHEPQIFAQEGLLDFHSEPTASRVLVTDNVFDSPVPGSRAGEGFNQAGADLVNRNVIHFPSAPYWGGVLVSQNDYVVTTGIDLLSLQLAIQPGSGAWTVATTDGDKPGPRFAGTLLNRLPIRPAELLVPLDPGGDDRDSDGDGLIDRWDNCSGIANPGWRDSDRDGLGDACDP
jgi:hypothetical protein